MGVSLPVSPTRGPTRTPPHAPRHGTPARTPRARRTETVRQTESVAWRAHTKLRCCKSTPRDTLHILSQILGSLPAIFFRTATHHHHHHHRSWTSFKWAQHTTATPRCLRAGARGRRTGGASSWLSCDAARATCSSCLTPGRCSARASSVVEAAALRSAAHAARLVARSKRAVGQRAEPLRRARWSAYDSPMMPSH